MTVAFWTVHKGHGLLVFQNGWEYGLVLGAIGVASPPWAPGWSLDEVLGIDLQAPPAC